jgi:hypothetical protein
MPVIPDDSNWTNLWGIAVDGNRVWAAGTFVDPATDFNQNLVLEETGGKWTVSAAPNPGTTNNIVGAIANVGGQLWAAGLYQSGGHRFPLIIHQ